MILGSGPTEARYQTLNLNSTALWTELTSCTMKEWFVALSHAILIVSPRPIMISGQ